MYRVTRALRRVMAGLAVATLGGVGVVAAVAAPAGAAELDAITGVRITQPMSGMVVSSSVEIEATWSVADAHAGDTFRLGLPTEFRGTPASFRLLDQAGATVGTCQVTTSAVECTLSDYVEGYGTVAGTLYFWSYAVAENTTGTVVFDGGDGYVVDVPGGGIGPEPNYPFPTVPLKNGQLLNDGGYLSDWGIYVPAATILASDADPYVIQDTHDPRLTLQPETVDVYYIDAAQWQSDARWSYDQFLTADQFTLANVTSTGFTVSIDRDAIRPGYLYVVQYMMTMPDDAVTGDRFSNTATGSGLDTTASVTYQGAGGDGQGSNEPRSIALTKRVEGSAPADPTFGFSLACSDTEGVALPGYPKDLTVAADATTTVDGIPVGSTCTLTETDGKGGQVTYDVANPIVVTRTSPDVIAVTATNTFAPVPTEPAVDTPTPTPAASTPGPTPVLPAVAAPSASPVPSRLAHTGAQVVAAMAVAVLLLGSGGAVLAVRRRSAH